MRGLDFEIAADLLRQPLNHFKAHAALLFGNKTVRQADTIIADGQHQTSVGSGFAVHHHDQRNAGRVGVFHGVDENLAKDQRDRLHLAHQNQTIAASVHNAHLLFG